MAQETIYNEMCNLLKDLPNKKPLADFQEWYAANKDFGNFKFLFNKEYGDMYESLGGTLMEYIDTSWMGGQTKTPPPPTQSSTKLSKDELKTAPPMVEGGHVHKYQNSYTPQKYKDPHNSLEQTVNVIAAVVLALGIIGALIFIAVGIVQYDYYDDIPVNRMLIAMGVGALLSSLVIWSVLKMLISISNSLKNMR